MLQCDNARCNSKANGSWSGAKFNAPMALASSPDATPQVFAKGHPRFFVREIHKGSSWKFIQSRNHFAPQLASQAPKFIASRTPRCGNSRQGPAGRGRQVHLGLPRRCRPAHLRRVLQARHHPARSGAPRAGRRARGRRLCARHRRCRRGAGHLRSRRDQCGHRHCHGLHGQHPDGDHHRPGADRRPSVWMRSRNATPWASPAPSSSTTSWSRMRATWPSHEKGFPHCPQWPPRPGGGGHSEGRVVQEGALRRLPRQR